LSWYQKLNTMKKLLTLVFAVLTFGFAQAQDDVERQPEIQTIFKDSRVTGYGAITNKFTTIRGEFANMVGAYGGLFINRKVMIGLGGFATTNEIKVPTEFSSIPETRLSYGYVQSGLMTEWVMASNKSVHLVLSMFAGAGFSYQYEHWSNYNYDWNGHHGPYDQSWSFVMEPGAQLEINLFRWMRLSPGVSYRSAYNSTGLGLSDSDLSNWNYSFTLKFGKF
jgi:hypothetical protein